MSDQEEIVLAAAHRNPCGPRLNLTATTTLPPTATGQAPMAAAAPSLGRQLVLEGAAMSGRGHPPPPPRALSGSALAAAGRALWGGQKDCGRDTLAWMGPPHGGGIGGGAIGEVDAFLSIQEHWLHFRRNAGLQLGLRQIREIMSALNTSNQSC
jgi:hypothetical protein